MLQSLAPLEWRLTISIVCFVVDSIYFLIIIMFQRLTTCSTSLEQKFKYLLADVVHVLIGKS